MASSASSLTPRSSVLGDTSRKSDRFRLVTTLELAKAAVKEILQSNRNIAVDCEGIKLSRTGQICTIQICIYGSSQAYIFDVVQLTPEDIEECGLKTVLENQRITKIMYDCRQDSDALYHQLGVTLVGPVVDLQIMQFALNQKSCREDKQGKWQPCVMGMTRCIQTYAPNALSQQQLRAKEQMKVIWADEDASKVWAKRPLGPELCEYAATDVIAMCDLFAALKKQFGSAWNRWRRRIVSGSKKYVDVYRNYVSANDKPKSKKIRTFKI